jgi:hypothetical protein
MTKLESLQGIKETALRLLEILMGYRIDQGGRKSISVIG